MSADRRAWWSKQLTDINTPVQCFGPERLGLPTLQEICGW